MTDSVRTILFVAVAGVSIAAAAVTEYGYRPRIAEGFEKVGTQFYPDFVDPNEATSLELLVYSDDTATVRDFEVRYEDGLWRIPSRFDYPVDGKDRLANTASSIIGITRGALASRREADYEQYGVIDPTDEDSASLVGRGQRLKLKKGDEVLADFIIGKQVPDRTGYYYVRRPDEKETYLVELKIDLSTKFADWIEPDLLQLDKNKLAEIEIDKYAIEDEKDEQTGQAFSTITGHEISKLTRDKSTDPWKLAGLDEAREELETDEVRTLVNGLDDLRIVGVRPKPRGIGPDLSLDPSLQGSRMAVRMLVEELASKGFLIGPPDESGQPHLVARQGELKAYTDQGVMYVLHFGDQFSGTEEELEVGFAKDRSKKDETAGKTGDDAAKKDDEEADPSADETPKTDLKESRYLFVTTHFAPQFVPGKPEMPIEPQPPATRDVTPTDDEPADAAAAAVAATDEDSTDGAVADAAAAVLAATEPPHPDPAVERKAYEAALAKYQDDLKKYEADMQTYEEKLDEGKKLVARLNTRFGDWYYVISAESLKTLRLSRADLVKPKEKTDEPSEGGPANPLGPGGFDFENLIPKSGQP